MKIAIRILTIYIFSLSLVPCGDGGGGIMVIANHLFDIEIQKSSSCFTALDTVKEIQLPEKVLTSLPKTTPSFIAHFHPSDFNHFIWQPPQLG